MKDCKHLEAHEARFCTIETEAKSKVTWVVFTWAIGIITTGLIFGFQYVSTMSAKVSAAEIKMAEIQVKLANIETLLLDIKVNMKDLHK